MNSNFPKHPWYALQVRSRFEKVVATHLKDKGYEEYLPSYTSQRQWSDRTKTIELPADLPEAEKILQEFAAMERESR